MHRLIILIYFICLFSAIPCDENSDEDFGTPISRTPINADIVLAIDTAYYGWGDRTESDVFIGGLQPFLREFAKNLWTIPGGHTRVAVLEMAKDTSVLVDLTEGVNPTAVTTAFDRTDRRLSVEERKSTTHIYRMLNLFNATICNRSIDDTTTNQCVLIVVTVAPAPVRVPFVGADWPNWRIMGDAMIKSAFDLGVDIMIVATGYHESVGGKAAGLSEMARVEGRLSKEYPAGEEASKSDWALTYWQAGYDREKSVDNRVAKRTVAVLRRVLTVPQEEKSTPEEKPIEEKPNMETFDDWGENDERKIIITAVYTILFGTVVGFFGKWIYRLIIGHPRDDMTVTWFLMVLILNTLILVSFMAYAWMVGVLY